jgi:hypothetical protein
MGQGVQGLLPDWVKAMHSVVLLGSVRAGEATYCCVCLGEQFYLYLNWAQVITKLPVVQDREVGGNIR